MAFDDAILEFTIASDGYANAPFGIGTRANMRLLHTFEFKTYAWSRNRRADRSRICAPTRPTPAAMKDAGGEKQP